LHIAVRCPSTITLRVEGMKEAEQTEQQVSHAAEAAALGFYYQTLFALVTLASQTADNAAVVIEQLDDVELHVDGHLLLNQLKHSMSTIPPPVTLTSRALWKTVKVWIDALPDLTLSETTLCLVTVGDIQGGSPLKALLEEGADRTELLNAMQYEAQRVVAARDAAKKAGNRLPHAERASGCEAFLSLDATKQQNLLRRIRIEPNSPKINQIPEKLAKHLQIVPPENRLHIAERLIEWWSKEVLYSLCGKRERILTRFEYQKQVTSLIGDIEKDRLIPDFTNVPQPDDYQPDGMLTRQIKLVDGRKSDINNAIREEWRAREQRSKWINENPAIVSKINGYDSSLQEQWSDRHVRMVENCAELEEKEKRVAGHKLLRWTHDEAPRHVPAFSEGWTEPYYVRGSYQILAINLKVGWHPDYLVLLKDEK